MSVLCERADELLALACCGAVFAVWVWRLCRAERPGDSERP